MEKIDFKKHLPFFKAKKGKPEILELPTLHYLMIDGQGNPNTAKTYTEAIEALYTTAYTLKFMVKRSALETDYTVLPLEALWWADDMTDFTNGNKDEWYWTAMILQPEFITLEMYEEAKKMAFAKKSLPALPLLRFAPLSEGNCAQVLHIGPYNEEGPTIQVLHDFIHKKGHQLAGKHHEIYLGDPRKSAPEKLKTIIRQPFV